MIHILFLIFQKPCYPLKPPKYTNQSNHQRYESVICRTSPEETEDFSHIKSRNVGSTGNSGTSRADYLSHTVKGANFNLEPLLTVMNKAKLKFYIHKWNVTFIMINILVY